MMTFDETSHLGEHLAKLAHNLEVNLHNHTLHEKLSLLEKAIGARRRHR